MTATRFDAASDRASYTGGAGSPPTPSAGWSASWWVYVSADQNTFATMLRLYAGATVLNLAMGASGTAPGAYTGGGTAEVAAQCAVGSWYYLGYSIFGSAATVFVFDATGALYDSAAGTIGGGAPTGLTVGGRDAADGSEWFNGRLSRMRIWSTARTQAEFAAEQFAPDPVITANLWAHYRLTGAGDLTDAVGGHHLVAGGTATTTEDGPPLSTGVSGSAAVMLSGPSVVAAGLRSALGQASVPLGAATITALGGRQVRGSATAALGALGVAVVAARRVVGSSAVALAGPVAAAAGRRRVNGLAAVSLGGVIATGAARRAVSGAAAVTLGQLVLTVLVADEHSAVVRGHLAPQRRVGARVGARRVRANLGAQ